MSQAPRIDTKLHDIRLYVTNLPVPTTKLMGRQDEVAWVATLLRRPSVRLVTLTGIGGVGKTRLAIQVAVTLIEQFVHGIYFIDLAPIRDAGQVLYAVAQTLELPDNGGATVHERLKQYLRDKTMLLVLDNFEHVDAAARDIAALLASTYDVKFLVTSRSTLHLSGEHEFPVSAMATPSLELISSLKTLETNPAVALFVKRARAVKPDFQLDQTNAPAIVGICDRLGGLPLAIELAAARTKLLTPEALLIRLESPLKWLTSGQRDLPMRQQTLRSTIQWSFDLLSDVERSVFRRLGVFAGSFDSEAVAAICFANKTVSHLDHQISEMFTYIDELSAFEILSALIDKSLLQRVDQDDHMPRFQLHALIREFAVECLHLSGEAEWIDELHLAYFVALAEKAEPELTRRDQLAWLARMEREQNNVRAALSASRNRSELTLLGLRLASAMWWFWYMRGNLREPIGWLQYYLQQEDLGNSANTVLRILVVAKYRLALLKSWSHQYERAYSLAMESLRAAEVVEDAAISAWATYALGVAAYDLGYEVESRKRMHAALELFRATSDARGEIWALHLLTWQALTEHRYTDAATVSSEALERSVAVGNRYDIGGCFYLIGTISQIQSNLLEAELHFTECLRHFQAIGSFSGNVMATSALASNILRLGKFTEASVRFAECVAMAEKYCGTLEIAYCLLGLGAGAVSYGEFVLAAKLFAAAEYMHATIFEQIDPGDQAFYSSILEEVRVRLGNQAFAKAWTEGISLTPTTAVEEINLLLMSHADVRSESKPDKTPAPPAGLTQREEEVLMLLASGLTNAQMAERLIVSPFTINAHLRNIYNKIGTSSRAEAIRFALEHDLN